MPLTPAPLTTFGGGLNLRDKADTVDVGDAIDLLNIDFTERGAIKQRDGYTHLTTSELTNQPDSLGEFYTSTGTRQLVIGNGHRLDAIDTTGTMVASSSSPTASPHYFARFGGPGAEVLYAANGTDSVQQWDGSAFTVPSYTGTAPTGLFVAVTPWDNRLVNARGTGTSAGTNQSAIRFSDPGVPTTWGDNNYVDLTPGDGEAIMGLAVWEELLFVFKETKFFVFTGTSTDATGSPIFNYRAVETGIGLVANRAVTAARDGVYFLDRTGVYRTTGDVPELVSDKIGPFFLGGTEGWYQGGSLNTSEYANAAMTFVNERIYLATTTGTATANDKTLVYDPRYGWWSLWDLPAACLTGFRVGPLPSLVFGYATGAKHIGQQSSTYTNDDGVAITSRWRSGWMDFGITSEKTSRQVKLWGSGKVAVAQARDFSRTGPSTTVNFAGSSLATWDTGNWDTSNWAGDFNVLNPALMRTAVRGTVLNILFSNDTLNQAWSVHRAEFHIREQLPPSVLAA